MRRKLLIIVLLFVSAGNIRAEVSIFRPKIGVPAFVETNGVFLVEVMAPPDLQDKQWKVVLFNDLRRWTDCRVEKAEYGQFVYNNSVKGWRLKVRAVSPVPPGLFGVTVFHPKGGQAISRHCLKVETSMEKSFYILHFADPQIRDEKATAPNGQSGNYGSAEEIGWSVETFNLINPRFMLNTGDEMDDGDLNTANKFKWYLAAMERFDFPVLITRGNNDRGDLSLWKSAIGQPAYSVSLGTFHVSVCDASQSGGEMESWQTDDFSASFANKSIKYRLVGQHFSIHGDKTPHVFVPPEGKAPDLMLVGHNHSWQVLRRDVFTVLSSGPAFDYGKAAFFSFEKKENGGWACPSVAVHGKENVVRPFSDGGKPTVSCVYSNQNNGTATSNTAEINNTLGLDFPDGRVRFLMRRGLGAYKISGGELFASYDYAGGSNTAVIVKVSIPKNSRTSVSIQPQ